MAKAKLTDGYVKGLERDEAGRWLDPSMGDPFISVGKRGQPAKCDDVMVWDETLTGFGVHLRPSGAKLFFARYKPKDADIRRKVSLGEFEPKANNVTQARAAAKKYLSAVTLGEDPVAERRAKIEAKAEAARQAEAAQRDRVELVVDRYLEAKPRDRNTTTQLRNAAHAWAGKLVSDVQRKDVAELIDDIAKRSPSTARQTYAALGGFFDWCIERQLVETSPRDKVKKPPRPDARDRVLTDRELAIVWRGAECLRYPFESIVKLLILTGQREAEVAGMAWSELDLETATWTIPKERTKNGLEHAVDLSPEALEIVKAVPNVGPLLFPRQRKAKARRHPRTPEQEAAIRPVNGFSSAKRRLDGDVVRKRKPLPPTVGLAEWIFHDLRRTAATGMARLGHPPHVVERVLNHVSGVTGGLVGVYQRHEYRPERLKALTDWGAHVAAMVIDHAPMEEADEAA